MEFKIELPSNVKYILNTLNENGYSAYVVGGAVRDSLLGVEPHDWDIATNALPEQVGMIFADTIPTGEKYGTITVVLHSEDGIKDDCYEVTTFRGDGEYIDGRRPSKVDFSNSIYDDLSRRDFTINAMAYSDLTGLVDPFNGRDDIDNKLIKCVGSALSRFNEDALRMLRAVRFAFKLGFTIDLSTENAIETSYLSIYNCVSKERIRDEFIGILNSVYGYSSKFVECLRYLPCTFKFNGELFIHPGHYTSKIFEVMKYIGYSNDFAKIELVLRNYKFSNKDITTIINLFKIDNYFNTLWELESVNAFHIRVLMSEFPENVIVTYASLCNDSSKKILKLLKDNEDAPVSISNLKVDGLDCKLLGLEGKDIGKALNYCLKYVLKYPQCNNKDTLCNLLEEAIANGFEF